jgi:integrase/recombinase XerD
LKSSTVRWSAAESNWERAGAKAGRFVDAVDAGLDLRRNLSITTGELTTFLADHKKGVGVSSGLTIAETIDKFMEWKRAAPREKTTRKITEDSLYRYKFVLDSLAAFCATKDIVLIRDLTFSVVETWSGTWGLTAQAAKRGRQEKVRNFIKFCLTHAPDVKSKARILATNPIAEWGSFALDKKDEEVSEGRIIRRKYLAKVWKAVDDVEMTPENRVRVKACMKLQREAGLAIVDAVMLHTDELVQEKGKFRIKTVRQKTDNKVNNVISGELGKLLLKVKNGNPEYFFWSGKTLPEDAPSYFQKLYRKVFKKAGKDYSFEKSGVEHTSHDFRHTFAAYFLEAGNSTEDLSKALGHSDIKITQRYYSHFTGKRQESLDESVERTQAAMASGD